MLIRYAAVPLSILTIVSLELILLLGASGYDPQSNRALFDGLVRLIDLSLIASSGLLGWFFLKGRKRFLGALFLLNIAVFVGAVVFRVSGGVFTPHLLYATDLYWLNLYLICLTKHWGSIAGKSV